MDTPMIVVLPQTRREFCVRACQAASMLAIGGMAACGGGGTAPSPNTPQLTSVPGAVAGRVVSVTVDAASPLNQVGSAASVTTSLGTFLVARTSQDSFTAMTATCTHEGCLITGFANSRFVCP